MVLNQREKMVVKMTAAKDGYLPRMHTYMLVCVYINIYVYICVYLCVYVYKYVHKCVCGCVLVCVRVYMYIYAIWCCKCLLITIDQK